MACRVTKVMAVPHPTKDESAFRCPFPSFLFNFKGKGQAPLTAMKVQQMLCCQKDTPPPFHHTKEGCGHSSRRYPTGDGRASWNRGENPRRASRKG